MDNLCEEVAELKKLREEYEDQLKIVGFEICDLPDDISVMLDECVELQIATQLHDLSENYVKEFYFTKQKEAIENFRTITHLKSEIKQQEADIAKETEECKRLEKFITDTKKSIISETTLERTLAAHEKQLKKWQAIKDKNKTFGNLDIDGLVEKVDILKAKTKGKPKI